MTALVVPDLAHLPAYVAAMRRGWSPSTTRSVCAEQLTAIEVDAHAFLGRLIQPEGGTTVTAAGETVPFLPGTTRWIWDDGFCGAINLRHQPGTTALPPYVSGHIGYSVVPWRQREGHGTRALHLMLPLAAALGLPYVIITCDVDNAGSRKVIEANGGLFLGEEHDSLAPGACKLVYRITLGERIAVT